VILVPGEDGNLGSITGGLRLASYYFRYRRADRESQQIAWAAVVTLMKRPANALCQIVPRSISANASVCNRAAVPNYRVHLAIAAKSLPRKAEPPALFAHSQYGKNDAQWLHVFGLDQLDLLDNRDCTGRIWLLPPRYLRAMALSQSPQKR
jgi:hypothetical protein